MRFFHFNILYLLKINNMNVKVIPIFVLNLIKKNPIKLIALVVAIITFPFLNSLPDKKSETTIVKEIKIDGDYIYLSRDKVDGKIKYDTDTFNKKQKLMYGIYLIKKEYNELNIFIWILFIVALALPVFGTFMVNDDALNWNFEKVSQHTISYFIKCEEEDGTYYYLYNDRLLATSDKIINSYSNIAHTLQITDFTKLRSFPIWNSKQRKRNNKLEELGINE